MSITCKKVSGTVVCIICVTLGTKLTWKQWKQQRDRLLLLVSGVSWRRYHGNLPPLQFKCDLNAQRARQLALSTPTVIFKTAAFYMWFGGSSSRKLCTRSLKPNIFENSCQGEDFLKLHVGACAVISAYWKLFQASDWPTWSKTHQSYAFT